MKYQIGDDIIVLLSNEEGKVIEIMNDKMVLIEVRGVKFPAYMDQIDFPYFKRFTEKKLVPLKKIDPTVYIDQIPKEKPQPNQIKVATGVWLSFIPKFELDDFNDEVVDILKVHLVNKTDSRFKFIYQQQFNGVENFALVNEVLPFHDFYLHDISFASVNDSPTFSFDFSLFEPAKNKASHFETTLKLKPKQVFQKVEALKQNNEPTFSYLLFEKYPDKEVEFFPLDSLVSKGYKVYDASKAKELAKWIDNSIAHHQHEIVIIHGVGSGKLRDEVHEYLKSKKAVKYFINQYDARFGYGATMVYFEYK